MRPACWAGRCAEQGWLHAWAQGEGRALLASRDFMLGEALPKLALIPKVPPCPLNAPGLPLAPPASTQLVHCPHGALRR